MFSTTYQKIHEDVIRAESDKIIKKTFLSMSTQEVKTLWAKISLAFKCFHHKDMLINRAAILEGHFGGTLSRIQASSLVPDLSFSLELATIMSYSLVSVYSQLRKNGVFFCHALFFVHDPPLSFSISSTISGLRKG